MRDWMAGNGQPAYRADQVLAWVHQRHAADWAAMSDLPKLLRERLQASFNFPSLRLAQQQGSEDTTRKFLWRLHDATFVESVLIPANPSLYGDKSDRHTLCISTQVGCAYGCKFCASGLDGFKRNLEPAEIIEQVLAVERIHHAATPASKSRLVNNLVIMGMGEPVQDADTLTDNVELKHVERISKIIANRMPAFASASFTAGWTGPYDISPDWNPLVGAVAGNEGLFVAVGFSGHGFKLAPTIGEALAQTVLGKKVRVPIADYDPGRFAAGKQLSGAYGIGSIS